MPTLVSTKFLRNRTLALVVLLIVGAAAGATIDHFAGFRSSSERAEIPLGSVRLKDGPWGELVAIPFSIAAPDEALPIRALEAKGTHWTLPHRTEADFRAMLENAGLSWSAREPWLSAEVLHSTEKGVDLAPTFPLLRDLPESARRQIYQFVAQFPENESELTYLHKETLEERFAGSGVARETLALFRQLCCEHGEYVVFSGLEVMLAQLPAFEEKSRFLKALTRQKTMLLRIHVGPDSDLPALAEYWSKGSYATDVRTVLQSVAETREGAWLDVLMLLPPLPSSQLYYYPILPDALNPVRDCHWTSLNFFSQVADPNFCNAQLVHEELQKRYYRAPADPQYGDLVLFAKPDGSVIHSAVYLADDIVFTKNGSTAAYPWMLSSIADLLKRYSFQVAPEEHLTVNYLRKLAL